MENKASEHKWTAETFMRTMKSPAINYPFIAGIVDQLNAHSIALDLAQAVLACKDEAEWENEAGAIAEKAGAFLQAAGVK